MNASQQNLKLLEDRLVTLESIFGSFEKHDDTQVKYNIQLDTGTLES
jgi:hypothetical protein